MPYASRCKKQGIKFAEVGEIWEYPGDKIRYLILEIVSYPTEYASGEYTVMNLDTEQVSMLLCNVDERYALSGWRFVA